jgi:hypothetical protein
MRSRGLWLPDGRKSEANVIKSRNADVEAVAVSAVEGKCMAAICSSSR